MKNKIIGTIGLVILMILVVSTIREKKASQFTLEGKIKGLNENLYYKHPERTYTKEHPYDTIFVNNGVIKFSDTISKLSLIKLFTPYKGISNIHNYGKGDRYYPSNSVYLMFYAFPGAKVKVSGEITEYMNAYPSGDEYNNSLAEINKLAYPYYAKSTSLRAKSSFENDSLAITQLMEKSKEISKKGSLKRLEYIKSHPNSFGALYYLYVMLTRQEITDAEAIAIFDKVSPSFKNTDTYIAIKTYLEGFMNTREGMPVPSINTTATLDGQLFNIESLKGKYVLVDFWGVWCGPCVAEMPKVKEVYEKYKDKLVVLAINSGDTREKIQQFIQKNDYNWLQLMSSKENNSDNFIRRFNVKGLPSKFIIDPEGKIIKKYLGSGEEAFELLEKLLE